ncbi:hypothetical protein E3T43_17025 [Cryobacterium sp. Hh7]|uniref:hypothetical protein n=1 Tax=Cryobacterium sp. Hh7 TaxID=1259159 RepID=UPI0010690889|nr:hypothetical protein [Cryobacterium sp. Hh7]TFD51098.1 hypothetical protein E3T43_17025 [Cryobacterium sp. Hh7]
MNEVITGNVQVAGALTEIRLRELSVEWTQGLRGVSLIAELPFRDDEAYAGLSRVVMHYKNARGDDRTRVLRQYRAALLVGLTSIAANEYAEGTFWPAVSRCCGQSLNAVHQGDLGNAFLSGLDIFGLSRFETPHRYLGEILMHAAISVSGLAAYLELLGKKDTGDRISGAVFNAWIARTDPQSLTAGHHLPVPVVRFLTHGREVAEDFTDRSLDMLAALGQDAEADLSAIGLPQRITDEATQLFAEGALRHSGSRRGKRTGATQVAPELRYDPILLGVFVSLPPLAAEGVDLQWTVSTAERVNHKTVEAAWPGEPSVGAQIGVSAPSALVEVSVTPGSSAWSLDLVRQEDPLLIFDDSGKLLAPRSLLPQTDLTLLYPRMVPGITGLELAVIESDIGRIEAPEFDPPFGWEEWTVVRISATHLKSVRLTTVPVWRTVSSIEKPRLGAKTPLKHAFSRDGDVVLAQPPTIILPKSSDGAEVSWLVEITSVATGLTLVSVERAVSSLEEEIYPWPIAHEPLIGRFAIRVRGPLGRGLVTEVVLAEGFAVESSSIFRMMRADGLGLEPCELNVFSENSTFSAEPSLISMAPDQIKAQIAIQDPAGETQLTLSVEVDHMTVSRVFDGGIPAVSTQFQQLDIEFLSRTQLQIVTPNDAYVDLVLTTSTGIVQTLAVKGVRGRRSFSLAEISDSVTDAGEGVLRLAVNGVPIPIAECRPRRLAAKLDHHVGETLTVVGLKTRRLVNAAVYSDYAPWLGPHATTVSPEGVIHLPPRLQGLAAYKVMLRADTGGLTEAWPYLPDHSDLNTLQVSIQPLVPHADLDHRELALWLANTETPLDTVIDPLVAAMLFIEVENLSVVRRHHSIRESMAEQLRSTSDWFPTLLRKTEYSYREITPLLIATGMSTSYWETTQAQQDASVWERSPLAAILTAPGDQTEAKLGFRTHAVEHFGASALILMDGLVDPLRAVGGFEKNVSYLAMLPLQRLSEMRRESKIVPALYLDKDSRAARGWDLFLAREDRELRTVCVAAQELHSALGSVLSQVGDASTVDVMDCRFAGEFGWQALSALSMGLALAARLSARGHGKASLISRHYGALYTKFARCEPGLIQQDLVLAELYLRGREHAHDGS